MDLNNYLAKKDRTIQEHIDDLLDKLNKLFELGYIDKEIYNITKECCLYHDYGKANLQFQNRINNGGRFYDATEVAHNILSVFFIDSDKYNDDDYLIIFNAVLEHHSYCDNVDIIGNKAELIKQLLVGFKTYDVRLRKILKKSKSIIHTKKYILAKGMLHKCDYSASGEYEIEYKNDFLIDTLENWKNSKNIMLNDLQKFCLENTNENIIAIAQTGMGKTEGGLSWIGNSKGFFVLPLKTAINAIYERVLNLLDGKDFDNKVALLHSDILSKYKNLDGEFDITHYVTESRGLSIPLTITTLDQVFDFVFKYNSYELKLATLSYSKIVIDEIQMYDADLLAFLIYGIEKIIDVGGKFAILTATIPPFIIEFMEKNIQNFNYKRGVFFDNSIRHNVKVFDLELNTDYINEFYLNHNENSKILVICNTIKKAQFVYEELLDYGIDENKLNILHSKYIRKARSILENEILDFGRTENIQSGIWITTQIVEASLDIDFDYLFTELSDINGLFQRFGRCNRKGIKSIEEYNCFVYLKINPKLLNTDGKTGFIDETIYNISKNVMLDIDGYLSEEKKIKLIEDNFNYDKLKGSYFIENLKNNYKYIKETPPYEITKQEVTKRFRNIISYQAIPISVYNIYDEDIENNIKIFNSSCDFVDKISAMDNILMYTVVVGKYDIDFISGVVKIINIGKMNIYIVQCEYDKFGFKKSLKNEEIVDNFL